MIPAGYMAKRVVRRPEWLACAGVVDIYSISGCISKNFTDYIGYWMHNGFWLFDSPFVISRLAKERSIDMTRVTLFYYEVYGKEFRRETGRWSEFEPERSFKANVVLPLAKKLEGFDVASFNAGTSPECSPLSCNSLAGRIGVNSHCLIPSFDKAKEALDQGLFAYSEPGPMRVFAVYSADWVGGLGLI